VANDGSYLETIDEQGIGFRVTFVWHRDRFAHTVGIVDNERLSPMLASLEGTDDDDWPPSPPLQNLTIEDRRDGHRVALLVGMAGTSHWSVSIEPAAAADEMGFIVDVACRVKTQPRNLGSVYRAMAVPAQVDSTRAIVGGLVGVDAQPTESVLKIAESDIVVRPSHVASESPITVRWQYRIFRVFADKSGTDSQ